MFSYKCGNYFTPQRIITDSHNRKNNNFISIMCRDRISKVFFRVASHINIS